MEKNDFMKTTHSMPDDLLSDIRSIAFKNFKICKYFRQQTLPPEPIEILEDALFNSDESCLKEVGKLLLESGLTNGYDPEINEVRVIISMDILFHKIDKATGRASDNVFRDLADFVGYKVDIHGDDAFDAYNEEFLGNINASVGEDFQCSKNDFIVLWNYIRFVSMVLEYGD